MSRVRPRWPKNRISASLRNLAFGALALCIALGGCSSRSGRIIQVLANVRDTAPGEAWNRELAVLRDVVLPHIAPGDDFIVAPVGAHAYTDAPVVDLVLEEPSAFGANPLQLTLRNRRLLRSAYSAAERGLEDDRSTNETEIVAATMAAADRFASAERAQKILILDSTAYEQSNVVNMADIRQSLDTAAIARLIAHLRRVNELPDLRGVLVCVTGITAGEHGWADEQRVLDVRAFWRAFFSASGATLVAYGTSPEPCL